MYFTFDFFWSMEVGQKMFGSHALASFFFPEMTKEQTITNNEKYFQVITRNPCLIIMNNKLL